MHVNSCLCMSMIYDTYLHITQFIDFYRNHYITSLSLRLHCAIFTMLHCGSRKKIIFLVARPQRGCGGGYRPGHQAKLEKK